ncbi:MAG TPA: Gfo/Idh/MocA family oxidoreductase [Verrucomicrobiae bacterium]|nr:Gfo/Idh/MocA family oxidoreductase [Verrucomicrobiae bacterium]
MTTKLSRRRFLVSSSVATSAFWIARTSPGFGQEKGSANEKLNIAMVGTANQAGWDLSQVASQNIVALCDVDDKFLDAAAQKYPSAKKYNDFRRLLDQKAIDAVVIGTPDHTHAVATVAALKSGRHVYCEKPLTHTLSECRIVRETARKQKRVTQMGTQIHAGNNYRRVDELIQSGAIGSVREVHTWVGASYGGKQRPTETPPVPSNLHYDLWLGPVEERPYSPEYLPFQWRNWWAFGGGALADFGCHHMDLPHWALDLRAPLTVEAEGPALDAECPPVWLIVRYEYPARGEKPPVKLTWYHGGKRPPQFAEGKLPKWGDGNLFIGEKGMLLASYDKNVLLPEQDFADFKRPEPFIKNSIGHHKEWIEACKNGGATTCNFDYSGALTEAVLLGNVAFRTGKKLEWDPIRLKAKNCPQADQFIQHHYRKGWKI